MSVKIEAFQTKVQNFIKENNIDANNDGYINSDNEELPMLLSKIGCKNVEELTTYKLNKPIAATTIGGSLAGLGLMINATRLEQKIENGTNKLKPEKLQKIYKSSRLNGKFGVISLITAFLAPVVGGIITKNSEFKLPSN